MKRLIFLMLLLFSCKQGLKEGLNHKNQSQAQYYISLDKGKTLNERLEAINKSISFTKKSDSLFTEKLYQKQFLHFSLRQYDSVMVYSEEIEKNATSYRDYSYVGKQHHLIGYYYDEVLTNFDSAFYHYNLSKSYFLKSNDSTNIGRRLISMGLIQKNQNDFFGSKETLTEALQFLNFQRDSKYVAFSYNALATNHRKLLNYPDAIKYYLKAIESTDSKKDILIYKNNLAATYIDATHYKDAITLLENILQDSLLSQNQSENARVLDNLAYAKWLSGINIGERRFQNPLKIRFQNNDKRGQIASYTHLGEYNSKPNPKRAEKYFDSVIQLSKTIKIPRAEKDALKFLMKLKPQNVKLRDRYVFLQDSLYQKETKVKTQFAKYKYDDKVTQEENIRLEKENTEKELEASQQRNQKILYLGGLLFITAVLGFSIYGFRQRTKRLKQKSKIERLEAIHETEAELSRKLHDDHGGKLNQAMLMVQRDVGKSAILDKLESVYNQIRNFSREINAVDTGPDFWKGLKATLEYTKPTEVDMILNGGKELDWSLVGHQTKTILFKVLQELVINMARHSKAKQTVILFKDQNKELFVYYEDDGVGASEESLLRKNGLRNTEKRIQAIGGSITFDSEEGKGFRAEIRIPK